MDTSSQPTDPAPRSGLLGEWDKFIGPGATRTENALIIAAFLLGIALIVWRVAALDLSWSVWQWAVAMLVGADVLAGAVANATSAAKRWYHRPGQTARDHLIFVAVHAVHLALLALAFPEMTWPAAALAYGYLLGAAALLVAVPLYPQRPLAMLATCGGLFLALYALPLIPGLEWLLPVFYLKLLAGHLLRETPWPAA